MCPHIRPISAADWLPAQLSEIFPLQEKVVGKKIKQRSQTSNS